MLLGMKLDRNTNPTGRGKYALVNMRAMGQFLDLTERDAEQQDIVNAFTLLAKHSLIHFGNEGPGEQFFCMKYKDKFTAPALRAYADAVREAAFKLVAKSSKGFDVPEVQSLMEYATEISLDAQQAALFDRIPD